MWTHFNPCSAKLEQVFELLRAKVTQYDRAWSIAELRLAEDDVKWLRSWFRYLTPEITENWIKPVMHAECEGDAFVTYRQMFGSLLICAGAEVCREESKEDSVWPAIRNMLPDSHSLQQKLFLANGQPTLLTRDIIEDAVRALNLRHAMDIEGTQQWFVTIKLQFGFTYRGANNRLAEWLVNLGRPHAAQYLNGESEFPELTSGSFQSLWRALTQYRQGLINETEVRTTLQRNPWIKAHWINDLLKEAKVRIETLGTGEGQAEETEIYEQEVSEEELCPIASIALEWSQGTVPRLRFQLDRQAIEDEIAGTDVRELDFYIDGRRLSRWLWQKDGAWASVESIYAEPDKYKEQPNLSPRTLAVLSRAGESLVEWDFADSGLSEEVLMFDVERKRMIKSGSERLDPNRQYAIICDRKCQLQGCDPVETFERDGISRKVIRLASPLGENLCITYDDFVLWQPVRSESDQRQHFSLTLTTPKTKVLSLNDRAKLFLEGLPEDAESVELLIHKNTYEIQSDDGRWRTSKEVTITPELAARQRRVWVRFSSGGRRYTKKPRLTLRLLGAAMLQYKRKGNDETIPLEALRNGMDINRSEGTGYLRIWTPGGDNKAPVLEGNCRVGTLRHNKIKLKDLPGHGGKLHILSEGKRHSLGITCLDTGCVDDFLPAMFNADAQLHLLSEKNPLEVGDDGYVLFEWIERENHKTKLCQLSHIDVRGNSTERVWKIRCSTKPLAIALTWKGAWRGAWWDLELIRDYVGRRAELREQDFAIIKWLRVPVLHPDLSSVFARAVVRSPCRFVKMWLNDAGLPEGLIPHGHIAGLDSVVRHFLWNDFPPGYTRDAIALVTQGDGDWHKVNHCTNYLEKLSDISPILLWRGLEGCLKRDRGSIVGMLKSFAHAQVGLSFDANRGQFNYRLEDLEKRASNATGVNLERLKKICIDWFSSMRDGRWCPSEQQYDDLLRLGETHSGRRYLAAQMGQYWLRLGDR